MAIELSAGLPVDQYLDRSFDPECELLGGETRPKPFGTKKHSKMQKRLTRLLEGFFGEGRVDPEFSVRIGDEVPIPDIVVVAGEDPRLYRDVLDEPPLLCVEIVSPSQRPDELLAKCERYLEFGVPFCWVIDPVRRRAWEYHLGSEPREVTELLFGPCILPLSEVFTD
jgi:Uma2 family endonuclease